MAAIQDDQIRSEAVIGHRPLLLFFPAQMKFQADYIDDKYVASFLT